VSAPPSVAGPAPRPADRLAPPSLYPFESRWLDLGGVRMHYIDEGRGDPVVMLHGNPTWSFYYRNLVLALRDTYRCVVPDHIGCGLSDKPPESRYDYSLKSRLDDLEALLDHLGLRENLTLVPSRCSVPELCTSSTVFPEIVLEFSTVAVPLLP